VVDARKSLEQFLARFRSVHCCFVEESGEKGRKREGGAANEPSNDYSSESVYTTVSDEAL
jgi:hypothetical protein